jgi:hypothetical protein
MIYQGFPQTFDLARTLPQIVRMIIAYRRSGNAENIFISAIGSTDYEEIGRRLADLMTDDHHKAQPT